MTGCPRTRVVYATAIGAVVADLVPAARRGLGYGMFTTAYGPAWLAGSTVIGALYSHPITAAIIFTAATRALALGAFIPLAARGRGVPSRDQYARGP